MGSEAQCEFLGALQKQSLTEETLVSRADGIAAFNRNKKINMKLEGERKRKGGKERKAANATYVHVQSSLCELQRVSESVQTEEEGSDMCLWFYPRSF